MAKQVDSEPWWSKARGSAAKRRIDGGRSKTARDCKDVHEGKRLVFIAWRLHRNSVDAPTPAICTLVARACTVILHLQFSGLAGFENAAMPGRHSVLRPCATSDRPNGRHVLEPDMCCTLTAG